VQVTHPGGHPAVTTPEGERLCMSQSHLHIPPGVQPVAIASRTIQIVTHRVDWFSCLAFVLLQYMPARPPNLILYFNLHVDYGRPQISLSKAACSRTAAGCAPLA